MPVVFRWKGYRFFFFSNEGDPREPVHIHVRKGEAIAKYWVEPEVSLAESWGFSGRELRDLRTTVKTHAKLIKERWNEYFEL